MPLESRASLDVANGCVFRGIPAGYSDGIRPPFRGKSATDSDGKAAAFRPAVGQKGGRNRSENSVGAKRILGNLEKVGYPAPSDSTGRRQRCPRRDYRCVKYETF